MKILVKFPSRERPDRFFKSLDTIYTLCKNPQDVYVLCTFDFDDSTMNNQTVKTALLLYHNLKAIYGQSDSKIHAINRDLNELPSFWEYAKDWQILVVMSDDMLFNIYGWDEIIRAEMSVNFPNGDGYLHFTEKDSQSALCVMTVCDRKYYERFGFVYDPRFKSLFCDNVQMELAKMLGRYAFVNQEIFLHLNPAYGYIPRDDMFDRQQEIGWTADQELYHELKEKNFEIERWYNQH